MKSIFFFYLPWNNKCGYSIWSSTRYLLLTQLPAGMTESQWDLLTFLKVSSNATQNRTKHPSWMRFMLIPESIHFQDHYWAFMHCQKIVFQQFSHSLCCIPFGAFYIINHLNFHCISRSPCVIIRNMGNHFFVSSQIETGKIEDKERWKMKLQLKSFWVLEVKAVCLEDATTTLPPAAFLSGTARFLWHLEDTFARLRHYFVLKETTTC